MKRRQFNAEIPRLPIGAPLRIVHRQAAGPLDTVRRLSVGAECSICGGIVRPGRQGLCRGALQVVVKAGRGAW
jgi:hypothetical protein